MPPIKIYIKSYDATWSHASDQSPLVMGQVHGSNAGVTSGVNVQLLEVAGLPDLHHAIVPSGHQVLAVAAQENGPCGVIDLHLSQKFPVNAEIAEPPSLIVYDTVAFTRDRNQTREQAVLGSLEGSQQIASDRVDEARAFFSTTDNQAKLCTDGHTHNFMVVACEDGSWGWVVAAVRVVAYDMVSPAPVPEKQCGISRPRHDVAVAADVGLRPSQARDHIPVAKDDLSQFPCFCRVNSEAFIPESADENIAIICCDHKTMRVDLYTLVNEVRDLPFVHTRVIGN